MSLTYTCKEEWKATYALDWTDQVCREKIVERVQQDDLEQAAVVKRRVSHHIS